MAGSWPWVLALGPGAYGMGVAIVAGVCAGTGNRSGGRCAGPSTGEL